MDFFKDCLSCFTSFLQSLQDDNKINIRPSKLKQDYPLLAQNLSSLIKTQKMSSFETKFPEIDLPFDLRPDVLGILAEYLYRIIVLKERTLDKIEGMFSAHPENITKALRRDYRDFQTDKFTMETIYRLVMFENGFSVALPKGWEYSNYVKESYNKIIGKPFKGKDFQQIDFQARVETEVVNGRADFVGVTKDTLVIGEIKYTKDGLWEEHLLQTLIYAAVIADENPEYKIKIAIINLKQGVCKEMSPNKKLLKIIYDRLHQPHY